MRFYVMIFTALISVEAWAGEFMTGNKLYQYLTSQKVMENTVALGYIQAIHDVYINDDNPFLKICSDSNVTGQQPIDIVAMYLKNNPKIRNGSAGLLANIALADAFPCPLK